MYCVRGNAESRAIAIGVQNSAYKVANRALREATRGAQGRLEVRKVLIQRMNF